MKILLVIDGQHDFIYGVLGTPEAVSIMPNMCKKISTYKNTSDGLVIYTRDTHKDDYLSTQEGKLLPIPHCIYGTKGWQITDGLFQEGSFIVDKTTFGSTWLPQYIMSNYRGQIDSIELIGVCTDICVVSNALILKAYFPEVPIIVDASCCAGTSIEAHKAALTVMKSCQVEVINED
jgi:nicotinamidase-related amidase